MTDVKEKESFFKKVKNLEDQKKHKIAKILSFAIGACFDFLGIIFVAIWKYLFCDKEENSKYCIRLSIFGMIVKCIICAKLFSFMPTFISSKIEADLQKPLSLHKHINQEEPFFVESFVDDDVFNFDFNIDKEIKKINDSFKKQNALMNKAFKQLRNEIDKNEKKEEKKINVKKNVKRENGFETTTIEKTGPQFYQKNVNIRYVGDKKQNDKKKLKAKIER